MKILVVGETHPWSAEVSYARIFTELGCEVMLWNNKRRSIFFGNRSWWSLSTLERFCYNCLASALFYRTATRYMPDVIFMPKADNIHSRAVSNALASTKAKLVIWYPDHPFKADMTSWNVIKNLYKCSIFYIWGQYLLESVKTAGCKRVEYLPFGFDPPLYPTTPLSLQDEEYYKSDICFVGAWDQERERDLAPLAVFDLAIWGPGWNERISPKSPLKNKIRGGALYNEAMVKAYRSTKVVFNHLRDHNGSAHNNRSMEIAGIGGGIQLVRRTPELAHQLFFENKHLLCFSSTEELKRQAFSAISSTYIAELSMAARVHTLEHHLLRFRLEQILCDIG